MMLAAEKAGADVLELGVPFSDPTADGAVIEAASLAAIKNGITLSDCLDYVAAARKAGLTVPVVLMGYYNTFLQMGVGEVCKRTQGAGADGFIIVDLPFEEAAKGGLIAAATPGYAAPAPFQPYPMQTYDQTYAQPMYAQQPSPMVPSPTAMAGMGSAEECGDYKRGVCSRGAGCKYGHTDPAGGCVAPPPGGISTIFVTLGRDMDHLLGDQQTLTEVFQQFPGFQKVVASGGKAWIKFLSAEQALAAQAASDGHAAPHTAGNAMRVQMAQKDMHL